MPFTIEEDPSGNRITNDHDLSMRFGNSVVLYNGWPHYVQTGRQTDSDYEDADWTWDTIILTSFNYMDKNFRGAGRLKVKYLEECENISVDFSGMGWTNTNFLDNPCTYFLTRLPARRYKQGLDTNNVIMFSPRDNYTGRPDYNHIALSLIPSNNNVSLDVMEERFEEFKKQEEDNKKKYIKRCKEIYPDRPDLLDQYKPDLFTCALSSEVCLVQNLATSNTFDIYVGRDHIGECNHKGKNRIIYIDGLHSVYSEILERVGL